MSPQQVRYILSTHWDREWYQTFQVYRQRLVQLFDLVLAELETGRLAGPFTCDGQAIILDDYLEIRPERAAIVRRRLEAGDLVGGPWYVMPDEFLVSGESLIRNLRHGRNRVRALGGKPSDVGFLCDTFGHISQMPQIFKGFGLRGACIWRGLNQPDSAFVMWRGADGTELPTFKFWRDGYCDYAFKARRAGEPEWRFAPDVARSDILRYLSDMETYCPGGPLVLFDGGDHQAPQMEHYLLLHEIMRERADEYEFRHVTLDALMDEIEAACRASGLVVQGETREPGKRPVEVDQQWLIPGVLSSRVWIKQANAACEQLLCHWAEPMTALATQLLGIETPPGYLDVAWQWLLQNHPHDSICGCSIDQVHEDMRYRFSQALQIGKNLTRQALEGLAAAQGAVEPDTLRVVVFNPLPYPMEQVVELTLDIPTDWPKFAEFFGYEDKPAFRLFAADGAELSYQRLQQSPSAQRFDILPAHFVLSRAVNPVRVALRLKIPACGWTTLNARPGVKQQPTRHPGRGLRCGERKMANEFLAVEINPDGTLEVTDLRTGAHYARWMSYEDCADIGDGWFHGPAVNDVTCSGCGPATIEWLHDGPFLTAARIITKLVLPREFDFHAMRRTPERVEQTIETVISLRPGEPWINAETSITNEVLDHRLRVLFPSGAVAATHLISDGAFDVLERPIELPPDNHEYRELAVEARPQQSWSAVADDARGVALMAPGLYEVAAPDLPERPLALTLLRATRRTVMTSGEPGGQLLNLPLSFKYRLLPLNGLPDRVALCRMAQQFATGLEAVQLTSQVPRLSEPARPLPPELGNCQVDGDGVVTSLRQVGDAVEVRLFNPRTKPGKALLHWGSPQSAGHWLVQAVDFESHYLSAPRSVGGSPLQWDLAPRQIVTLRLFQPQGTA